MARSADPVQAARKAAVKREAKRNRERKEQAQEARALRQDTTHLERQIQRLESRQDKLDHDDQEELQRLQAEVASIKRIKEDYIRKHPDQRNFVRGYEDGAAGSSTTGKVGTNEAGPSSESSATGSRSSAPAQTSSRDPRWSIYYDPVFNPYGAPPPGMPYLEKPHAQLVAEGLLEANKPPPLPEETADFLRSGDDSDDSSVDEELKDIIMPAGPPPIRLDPGSSFAGNGAAISPAAHNTAARGRGQGHSRGGRGRGSGPAQYQSSRHGPSHDHNRGSRQPHNPTGLPPRPPGILPTRPPPHVTAANASPSGPPKPPEPPPAVPDGLVISAEPQLRDFKKESTAFVPAALRKKQQEEKARIKRGLPGRIDAAPSSEDMSSSSSASHKNKPDLLKSVQAHLLPKDASATDGGLKDAASNSSKKEYDQFLNEIGDLL